LNKNKEEDFIDILKLVAPGTEIRQGLENILKAKTRSINCSRRFERSFRHSRWWFLYKCRLYFGKAL